MKDAVLLIERNLSGTDNFSLHSMELRTASIVSGNKFHSLDYQTFAVEKRQKKMIDDLSSKIEKKSSMVVFNLQQTLHTG